VVRRVNTGSLAALVGVAAAAGALTGCPDAEHDIQVAALGGEAPGVSPGPSHRPGQPCLVCHGGIGPAKLQFSVAGTVYGYRYDPNQTLQGAQVQLEDATGYFWHVSTNSAGNFYILSSDWSPTYPLIVPSVVDPSQTGNPLPSGNCSRGYLSCGSGCCLGQAMITLDNRDGSCASCHGLTQGTDSVGPIYVNANAPDGG
jgi:hypothetical protein